MCGRFPPFRDIHKLSNKQRSFYYLILRTIFCEEKGLGYTPLTIFAALGISTQCWFAKTSFIPSFDLFRVNICGNTFSTYPATDIVRWLIHNPGPLALYANVSHCHISSGQRSLSIEKSCLPLRSSLLEQNTCQKIVVVISIT